MQNNLPKAPSYICLIFKTLAVILATFILTEFLIAIVYTASGADTDISKADAINRCEREYHSRDFARLYDILALYDLYDETYDAYWEAVEGYNTLLCYYQWQKAAQLGIDGAQDKAQELYRTLDVLAQNPTYPQNSKILKGFLEQAASCTN